MTPEIVFLVSNDRHHPAMMVPVMRILTERREATCRVVSLCEFRGQPSPTSALAEIGVECRRALPFNLRKGPVGRGVSASKTAPDRHRRLQALTWRGFLGPRFGRLFSPAPALVVLPNDAAYPFDRVAGLLGARGIAFLLLQEGIRFELPGVPRDRAYGTAGALAIAAWGESSAAYFRGVGVDAGRIHVTGSPRFDQIRDLGSTQPGREPHAVPSFKTLLLVTNPIDEQGFCSRAEKLALVRRFVDETAPLVANGSLRLEIKLHASESDADYRRALAGSAVADQITILESEPLYPLLQRADAAVILASTVGLEALLFDVSLGVLEIPGAGFVFDYVAEGAARGLTWSEPMAPQVNDLLDYHPAGAARFLSKHLERSRDRPSAEAVADLALDLARTQRSRHSPHERA